ncbi:MAG: hypothetical protein JWP77_1241, partial [Polaromonas sp.]|nr:hypothetical protein [Polaromonas sp.]
MHSIASKSPEIQRPARLLRWSLGASLLAGACLSAAQAQPSAPTPNRV